MKLHSLVPNSYNDVSVSDLYIPRISLPIWLQQYRQTNPGKIHECGNWETEHYNLDLEIMRWGSFFLGIHKSQTDIYIGFSSALHLQCTNAMPHLLVAEPARGPDLPDPGSYRCAKCRNVPPPCRRAFQRSRSP
jgi:hypothetical protein